MNRDKEYLSKLQDYYAKHRILPSFSGVGALVGMKSKSAVSVMVGRLMELGYLAYAPDRRIQPGKRFFERDVAGTIQAGLPRPANDLVVEACSIDEYLIESPSRTVMLTIRGESMIEAGLMSGDTVIVKKGVPAKLGDIVVAIVDNEFTVKYLEQDKVGFYLRPSNEAFPLIRPHDHLEIFGLVVGAFRKYA
ncbi:LexA family protein [Aeromonas veronii]|uniref:LexA family protein n=1 Tax=Aeromonas veronii TaxID=654 RepID=UPI000E1F40D8|nr:S24 family peptidase [Aeromonas veronii]RDU85920.1 LexA family transcriptional repressor [Aeromonas veronii]RDU94231.1 LexA family transcriptional repressor [Aeromonas veronii]TEY69173.1 LexA family transcriptional repressor [Aeromonas veronii]